MRNIKAIKYDLKPWAKSTFGHIEDKLQHNLYKINYVEEKLINNLVKFRLNNWLNQLVKQREKMLLFNQNIGDD